MPKPLFFPGDRYSDIEDVPWKYVVSSNLEAVRYHERSRIMQVMFLAKGKWPRTIYEYTGVSVSVYRGVREAGSHGKAFWRLIRRAGIPYRKIG